MTRIRRGDKRIRGSGGGRTRNQDCCCDTLEDCSDFQALVTELSAIDWIVEVTSGSLSGSGSGACSPACPNDPVTTSLFFDSGDTISWGTPDGFPCSPGGNWGGVSMTCIDGAGGIGIEAYYRSPDTGFAAISGWNAIAFLTFPFTLSDLISTRLIASTTTLSGGCTASSSATLQISVA